MNETFYIIEPIDKKTTQTDENVPFPHNIFKINKKLPQIKGF